MIQYNESISFDDFSDTTNKLLDIILTAYSETCATESSFELKLDVCTGLAEPGDELFLNVYPNPSNDRFNLRITGLEQDILDLAITSGQGQNLFSYHIDRFSGNYSNVIDMSYYSPGIYYLRISNNSFSKIVKLVKY